MATIEEVEQMIDDTLDEDKDDEPDFQTAPSIDQQGEHRPLRDVHGEEVMGPDGNPIMIGAGHLRLSSEAFMSHEERSFIRAMLMEEVFAQVDPATAEMVELVATFLQFAKYGRTGTIDPRHIESILRQANQIGAQVTNVSRHNPPREQVPVNGEMRSMPGRGNTVFNMDVRLTFTVRQAEMELDDE